MRAEGYYWVKVNESRDWEIAFWWKDVWCFPGFTSQIKQVFEIDERRIERQPEATKIIESTELPKGMIILKDIGDGFKQAFPNVPPQYISDNPYLCE